MVYTSGWFEEVANIALNSFFGPVVSISFPQGSSFYGAYAETISRGGKLRNNGKFTAYISS